MTLKEIQSNRSRKPLRIFNKVEKMIEKEEKGIIANLNVILLF